MADQGSDSSLPEGSGKTSPAEPDEGSEPSREEAEALLLQMALAFSLAQTPPGLDPFTSTMPGNRPVPAEETVIPGQKRVEDQLRKAEARYRTLVEQIPAVTFMAALDAETHELYVSPQIEELLGFTQEEWLDDPFLWYRQLHPDDRPNWQVELLRTCATGVRFRSEYRLLARDGRIVWVHGEAQLVRDAEGKPLFIQGIAFDITERKRAEERHLAQLRAEAARAEAEAANRAKDHFLAVLSHELRNPLNPVIMATSTALQDPATPPEIRELLAMIHRNVQLEARLIDDLLDMTRITRGKLSLRPERIDTHALIHQTLEICDERIRAGGFDISLELAARAPHVKADPARLQQVLWNLINNALKFTPAGGRIAIRSRNQEVESCGSDRLVIEVSDDGIGIAADVLSKIFDPFERGDLTIAQQYEGIGLGLAISRSLTEASDGILTAASAGRGKGTTFTLDLATEPAPVATPPAITPSPRAVASPTPISRLLVVEDNADSLWILARYLRKQGFHVTTASGVVAALEATTTESFDLVISDIGLPDGSGLDLFRQIKERAEVKGIAVSGFGMDEDFRKSREAGFDAHLTKPLDFSKLEAAIHQIALAQAAAVGDS